MKKVNICVKNKFFIFLSSALTEKLQEAYSNHH